jgi:hypothetical protein
MIQPDILKNSSRIRDDFQRAKPFRHVVLDNFLDASVAESMLADFPPFDKRKAVNEVGEVGRKAVVESVKGLSSFYREFYTYINSRAFLAAMSELTGIPGLLADDTLFGGGTHENLDGQALDVHVDFNIDERRMLHRRINLLIYLNQEWDEAWGGAIELHSNPWYPESDQVQSFLPLFNRALIFETNEYSWHGFKRIALPEGHKDLSRKSFSIYLYTKDRPVEDVVAPHTTFYVPPPLPEHIVAGATLSELDAQQLRIALQTRDGLIRMYQKLLVEKEQRLRDVIRAERYVRVLGSSPESVFGSRSWRVVMAVSRLRHRLARSLGKGRPDRR